MLNVNCIYCKTILLQLKECIICTQSWSWSKCSMPVSYMHLCIIYAPGLDYKHLFYQIQTVYNE